MYLKLGPSILLLAIVLGGGLSAAPQDVDATPTLANSDPTYIELRQLSLTESFDVTDLALQRDAGLLQLSGQIAFAPAVGGRRVLGVFTGVGQLILEPSLSWEQRNLAIYTGEASLNEEFSAAVFWFTDDTYEEITTAGSSGTLSPDASGELERVGSRLRQRRDNPQSSLEAALTGEEMDNFEAVVLTDLLSMTRSGSFMAFLRGKNYSDLRYFVRPSGAVPQVLSTEEVALINYDVGSAKEGIWYLARTEDEYENGRPNPGEDKATTDTLHYAIETTIGGSRQIDANALVRFRAMKSGDRVLRFGLIPELRVNSVNLSGESISFVQEERQADGSFYVVLPEALVEGTEYELAITYSGKDVIRSEGGGNFAVGSRTSWYPSMGSFKDRATFDLTFHYPKKFDLVSVGQLQGDPEKGKEHTTSHWVSDVPLTVAGFNYGDYKKFVVSDDAISYEIEGYATARVPDFLRDPNGQLPQASGARGARMSVGQMSPRRMMEGVVAEAQASMRVFTQYFGALPFGRVAITQQPQFSFGQSWPSLVYLPVSAFLDATQRWQLLGSRTFKFSHFIQEVTPHEVAHQWWGHVVGWDSYHDQWISEGFADFSAGLYLQLTREDPAEYLRFLERSRLEIVEKNEFGYSPNMVGPVWMGHRLATPRTPRAGQLIYSKGGYILHMLRGVMFDPQHGDAPFIEMMQDFVTTYQHQNATTEDFQAVVEKHMSSMMSTMSGGNMDWFFNQWVYGTEIPSYEFAYRLTPQGDGQTLVEARVTQSGVSDEFVMPVTLYGESDGRQIRWGSIAIRGSGNPQDIQVTLPVPLTSVSINANHDVLAREVREVSY